MWTIQNVILCNKENIECACWLALVLVWMRKCWTAIQTASKHINHQRRMVSCAIYCFVVEHVFICKRTFSQNAGICLCSYAVDWRYFVIETVYRLFLLFPNCVCSFLFFYISLSLAFSQLAASSKWWMVLCASVCVAVSSHYGKTIETLRTRINLQLFVDHHHWLNISW